MKKWLSMLLVAVMALSLVSAGAEEYTLPFGNYDTDTLTIACGDNYYAAASYAEPLEVLESIEKTTGVQIAWDVTVPSQYDEVMRVRLAAGVDLPDIVQIPGSYGNKGEVFSYASQGILIPLEDLIKQYAPNLSKLIWEEMPELGEALTAPDGHIYHIAQNFDGTNKVASKGLLLRTDWLTALNLEVPTTADEWYTVLKAFKEQDPNGNGQADEIPLTAFGSNPLSEYGYLGTAFGLAAPVAKYIDVDGAAVCQYDLPGFKDFLTFLNKLYTEGLMDPQYTLGDESKMNALCSKDLVGCSAHYADIAELWEGTAKQAGNPNSAAAEYHMVCSPKAEDGTEIRLLARALTGFCYGVTRDCKNPELAVKWLDYIYANPEGRDTMLYGLEGLTYTVNADGSKTWTDFVAKNPDGLNVASALRSVGAFPAQFSNRTLDFGKMLYSQRAAEESEAVVQYQILPFPQVMGTEEELDEIASLSADIDTYESEMIQNFITGQTSLDGFDSFRETVRGMGGDDLTNIYQAQLDRYYQK
ncbi:MAG: extracellular solute-binding protein [Eubacteriales bacterium]|nr:extracellular solute-binding protein [Eubacteriales bacterium]